MMNAARNPKHENPLMNFLVFIFSSFSVNGLPPKDWDILRIWQETLINNPISL
jgi:hypothetical protein